LVGLTSLRPAKEFLGLNKFRVQTLLTKSLAHPVSLTGQTETPHIYPNYCMVMISAVNLADVHAA
jgi:hypothetical protein